MSETPTQPTTTAPTPPDRRVIFVDVDGTLVDHTGRIPQSARNAIRAARNAGHLALLCTGRSPSSIWDDVWSVGWDGMIGAAGGHVSVGGRLIVQGHLDVEQVRRVVDYFTARDGEFLLETNTETYASPGARELARRSLFALVRDEQARAQLMATTMSFVEHSRADQDLIRSDVNKVLFLGSSHDLEQISADFPDFDVVGASMPGFGGELSRRGVNKASGVQAVLDHLGWDRAASVGFGDNYNDLAMLEYVAVGVAMGDAPLPVQAAADLVTAPIDRNGLALGLRRVGVA